MIRRNMGSRASFAAGCAASLLAWASNAAAGELEMCVDSHTEGQVLENKGQLLEARAQFLFCVSDACPDVVRNECSALLQELEPKVPTVVLGASTPSGNDETTVDVFVDGTKFTDVLDGRAIPINPGQHVLEFRTADGRKTSKTVVIREGERARSIVVELANPEPPSVFGVDPPPSASEPKSSSIAEPNAPARDDPTGEPPVDTDEEFDWTNSYTAYALWGVAAGALGAFIGLGLAGTAEGDECTPNCTPDQVQSVQTKYNVADVMLGVSIASTAAGAYFFFFTDDAPSSSNGASARRYVIGVRGTF